MVSLRLRTSWYLTLPLPITRRTVLQKVRGCTSYGASTACKHRVSGSFSLPSRGSFHLSFTVLYAIGHRGVFRLGGWSPRLPTRFLVSRGTLDPARLLSGFVYGIITLYDASFQTLRLPSICATTQSATPKYKYFGLACFPFARRYLGNRCFFLLLLVLRCFSSQRSLHTVMDWLYDDCGLHSRVSPFGHLRIKVYLQLPVAFRSLSRPSSALGAKASTLRS